MSGGAVSEYSWLLPSALIPESDSGGRRRRTTRDWIVDTVFFLFAFGYVWFVLWDLRRPEPVMVLGGMTPEWLIPVDVVLGVLTSLALWLRRRWPVGLAVATLPLGLFSVATGAAQAIIVFTVVVHRRFAVAASLAGAGLATSVVYDKIHPDPQFGGWLGSLIFTAVLVGSVFAWGMFVRARRQLVLTLRDRAERAEAEQQLRVAQARQVERTRIAREMHDVLAHRISLLSLHAGALEFRPDAAPTEVARAAGVIRSSAHQALEDLREVIGVLREDPTADGSPPRRPEPERPQPTLGDLPALVAESREAGVRVSLVDEVVEPSAVPAGIGRGTYRIVQEGLTNARKHAPGASVTVTVGGGRGAGINIEVRNRWPVGQDPPPAQRIPGTGTGLVGLAERADLVGGRLEHGRTDDGDFRLGAWLPWPA